MSPFSSESYHLQYTGVYSSAAPSIVWSNTTLRRIMKVVLVLLSGILGANTRDVVVGGTHSSDADTGEQVPHLC